MAHSNARSVSGMSDSGHSNGTDETKQTRLGRPGRRRGITVATASRAIPLTALTRAYLDDLKVRNFKPKTIQGYANKLGRFTRWAESVGECRLQDFNSSLVKRSSAYRQTQRRWQPHPTPHRQPQPPLP